MRILFVFGLTALCAVAGWGGPLPVLATQKDACLDYTSASKVCSGALSGSLVNGSEFLTFADVASVSWGVMHVATSESFNVVDDEAWSYGFTSFQDNLTINSPTMNGQTGTITAGYFIDGTVSASGQSDAFLQVVMRVFDPTLQNWVDDFHANTAGSTLTHQFQIVYGQPFTLYFSMQATAGTAVDSGTGYSFVKGNGAGSGSANFSDTFELTQLTPMDVNGNVVGDATFTSDSGTAYSAAGLTPEPATMVLMGVGLVLVVIGQRRRASRDR